LLLFINPFSLIETLYHRWANGTLRNLAAALVRPNFFHAFDVQNIVTVFLLALLRARKELAVSEDVAFPQNSI
jgi:hypothetical protein